MNNTIANVNSLLFTLLFLLQSPLLLSQMKEIGLQEAMELARSNYSALERDQLSVEYYHTMADAGVVKSPAQIFVSGDEIGFDKGAGIHSLEIQQNFFLPQVGKAQESYFTKGGNLAERQLELTERRLKLKVEKAYYRLLFAKEEQLIVKENINLYQNFLNVTTIQFESGETGKIPQLAARSRLGQAQLNQEHSIEKYQLALTLFNQWLQAENLYDAKGKLELDTYITPDSSLQYNHQLKIIKAQKELAIAKVETEKVKQLPQIMSGFKLQTIASEIPFFGYQFGMNIPLFKRPIQKRIEAASVKVKMEEAAFQQQKKELERIVSSLRFRLNHELHVLEYLRDELKPIVEEQSDVNLQAYQEGEISYLEYLDGLEQVVKVKFQVLEALYNFNVMKVELDFWLGH